jgi:SAM-dependent methyltransferase
MKQYFDKENNQFVYIGDSATDKFWDDHWNVDDVRVAATLVPNSWVSSMSKLYLKRDDKVLEGGCGLAKHVYTLHNNGFNVVGIDYARETVKKLNVSVPELNIQFGDVRSLPFLPNEFDGYWSFGVIEHFWNGYSEISREMYRVIKPNGYLFLTFPSISPFRMWLAKKERYKYIKKSIQEPDGFYQFLLNTDTVIEDFRSLGFELVKQKKLDGVKGLKDSVGMNFLDKFYNSKNLIPRFIKKITGPVLTIFGVYHGTLLILKKRS